MLKIPVLTVTKKLTGRNGYRIRVGTYRIIYDIFDTRLVIEIVNVGKGNCMWAKTPMRHEFMQLKTTKSLIEWLCCFIFSTYVLLYNTNEPAIALESIRLRTKSLFVESNYSWLLHLNLVL